MPEPGDPYASAFVAEVGKCWRMIHDRQGQATHRMETPTWTGRWYSPRHNGDYWRVWSCSSHLLAISRLVKSAGQHNE
jgi:hypothetical protein